MKVILKIAIVASLMLLPAEGFAQTKKESLQYSKRTRIDFEDLLIQGQTKKADTVYLFERGESRMKSLVKKRKNFRKEIYENYLNY